MTEERVFDAPRKPCAECPWRTDVAPNRFTPERFRTLARTSYDMAKTIFACHKSAEEHPTVCAGFLSRGAAHNLTIRLAYCRGELEQLDRSSEVPLYADYRAMAIANGVDPADIALIPCRKDETANADLLNAIAEAGV